MAGRGHPGAQNGRVPIPTDAQLADIRARYYLAVQDTVLEHLRDRDVIGFGARPPRDRSRPHVPEQVELHIHDRDDLREAIRSGVVGFLLPRLAGPGVLALRVSSGDGTGIDTVATAALSLAEAMERDGRAVTAMTDGAGGLYLFAFEIGRPLPRANLSAAGGYAAELASRAPEIATTCRSDASGRALLTALPTGSNAPAPYSLTGTDPQSAAVPLTLDEVAAASAGMPLEIELGDVPRRIVDYGDLAAALSEATAPPA